MTEQTSDEQDLALGAGIDFADPHSRLAPFYLRTSHVVAVIVLAAAFVFLTHGRVWHTDVWGHLRFGEYIVQNHRLPVRELFSGDFADQDALYINYQWLAQAGAYWIFDLGRQLAPPDYEHQLGGGATLLATAHASIVAMRLFVLLLVFRRLTGSLPYAVLGVVLVYVTSIPVHLGVIRPQILGELALAVLLLPLSRPLLSKRALVLMPLVFVLWANCHGSFPIGFIVVGAFLAGHVLQFAICNLQFAICNPRSWLRSLRHDTQTRRLAAVLVLSVLAVAFLNPHGPSLLRYSVELGRNPNIPFMEEWKPLPPKSPSGYVFVATVLLLIPLLRWNPQRFTVTQTLLLLGFGWQTLAHARFLVWWCMIFGWVVVPHLHALGRRVLPGVLNDTGRADLRKTILAGLAAAALLLWSAPAQWLCFGDVPSAAKRVTSVTPWKASRYLDKQYREHPDLGRVVFASETLGDFLLWDLRPDPPVRVFCYTHVHLLTPAHWLDCMKVKSGDRRWQQVLDQHHVAFIVVESELYQPLIQQVRFAPERWQVVSSEPVFVAKRK